MGDSEHTAPQQSALPRSEQNETRGASQEASSQATPSGSVWARIQRHKVVEWTLAYAAFGYALLHGVEIVGQAFEWPHAIPRFTIFVVLLGMPVAATLAYYHGHRAQHRVTRVEIAILTVLLILAGGMLWFFSRRGAESAAVASLPAAAVPVPALAAAFSPPPHSIAVLPFTNLSGDPKQEYFSDGMSEELLNALTQLNDLEVMARTSSFSFKDQNVDASTIARKLNVGAILEGSVRRAGKRVRITVQLINGVNGFHLWSKEYNRDLTDILKVQADVASAVAQQLEVRLTGDEAAKIELGGTHNADAFDAYLRGARILGGQRGRGETLRDALAALDKAVALDPNFARAHAERAWALYGIASDVGDPDDRAGLREQARAAAERAVALAPDLGEAHAALASIRAYALFDYFGAAPEFERALALSPGSAEVQGAFAWYAADLKHYDEAIAAARRAVILDPQNPRHVAVLGTVLAYARRYPDALAAFRDFRALDPSSSGFGGNIAQTLLASGRVEQARQACESAVNVMDKDDRHECLALAYHLLGRQRDAERELSTFQTLDGDRAAYSYAAIYAQWNEVTKALRWLAKAEKLRDPLLLTLQVDWRLDPLRKETQFRAIVARMKFPP